MSFWNVKKEVETKVHWALTHGIAMKAKVPEAESTLMCHAPISLDPFKFPRKSFEKAIILAPYFNELIDIVSKDDEWLEDTLRTTAIGDPFTKRLLEIHRFVMKEGIRQKSTFSINRSDYMQHYAEGDPRDLLQVEINTIAASFASLSSRITSLHHTFQSTDSVGQLPPNSALKNLAASINAAHLEFIRQYQDDSSIISPSLPPPLMLFVVQPNEGNFSDQRLLEFELLASHGLHCARVTLQEIFQHTELDFIDEYEQPTSSEVGSSGSEGAHSGSRGQGHLTFQGRVVSVVYYRAGYGPGDYSEDTPSEEVEGKGKGMVCGEPEGWAVEWKARLRVERSTAIKCPNIQYHLTGTKKVQQALADPGVLERFLLPSSSLPLAFSLPSSSPPSPPPTDSEVDSRATQIEKITRLREVFAGLYSLDYIPSSTSSSAPSITFEELKNRVVSNPKGFVLKPQREGGGNNYYDEEMISLLHSLPPTELASFILMERILPPSQQARLLRQERIIETDCLCELGVYGVFLSSISSPFPLLNSAAGHLLRVKPTTSNEGGVAAGFAVLSSPFLVD